MDRAVANERGAPTGCSQYITQRDYLGGRRAVASYGLQQVRLGLGQCHFGDGNVALQILDCRWLQAASASSSISPIFTSPPAQPPISLAKQPKELLRKQYTSPRRQPFPKTGLGPFTLPFRVTTLTHFETITLGFLSRKRTRGSQFLRLDRRVAVAQRGRPQHR